MKSFKILKTHNVLSNIMNSFFINPLKFELQNPNSFFKKSKHILISINSSGLV